MARPVGCPVQLGRGASFPLLLACALLMGSGLALNSARAASIVSASPQGEVTRAQQLVVKFDEPVVAQSDGSQPDPVTLQCAGPVPPGSSAWITPQHWAYNFRAALPPGVRCTLSIKPGWKPLNGALKGETRFSFQTGGPSVESIQPAQGAAVEEDQHFLVQFNGPASEASVAANTWCEVQGIGERVPVTLVSGAAREALLKAEGAQRTAERSVLLRCQRPLPQDARLRLVFGPGIAAKLNPQIATKASRSFSFKVRAAFQAEFSCERERAQAPCLPIRPMRVKFSEPIARSMAEQLRIKPAAGGAALAPAFDKDDKETELTEIRFPIPLAENARYALELPKDLKDASGRPLANAASFPLTVNTGEAPPIAKFASAPFGILESQADPVLPLTIRHVQGDLRPGSASGLVRTLRLDDPVAILKAYARVQQLHERQIKAREAGLPRERWMQTVVEVDARGREQRRSVERWVGTREMSMLTAEAAAKRLDLPALQGGDPRPFEVVGIPLPQPGYHVVEIESAKLGGALLEQASGKPLAPMYVRSGVLVTNLAVHVKLERAGGLVWVTTLDRARPVPGADVRIFDCRGNPLFRGPTDAQGRARIAEPLKPSRVRGEDCWVDEGYFVTAQKPDAKGLIDTGLAFSQWNKGIDAWRFGLPLAGRDEAPALRTHTVFDRTLLRAGETVSMKHFVRSETLQGLALLKPEDLPTRAKLTHEGTGSESSVPLQWSGARSAVSAWSIPGAAALGRYRVSLERDSPKPEERRSLDAGSFRVEAFRVPLVDARLVPPKAPQLAPNEVALEVQMNYMSGGAMGNAALRGSAVWRERSLEFANYPDFSFQPPQDRDSALRADTSLDDSATDAAPAAGKLVADRMPLSTNKDGALRWTIPLGVAQAASTSASASATPAAFATSAGSRAEPALAAAPSAPSAAVAPSAQRPGELRAELSYQDPNGETQTVSTRVPTWPSGVVLGLRRGSWASARADVALTALALDTAGTPLKGQRIELRARSVQTLSTRKRVVGGFYAYDHRTEVKDLGVVCSGSTDAQGLLTCKARLDNAGEIELIAQAADAQGRIAQAATSVWVTRQGELWFTQDNDDRIDILPEKRRYEPGETARLQVRMPFREATALVAIEREGIVDTRTQVLRGDDPTVEVKIEPHSGPNVYVSVLVVRGRIREVPWYSFFEWGWRSPMEWSRAYWYEGKAYQAPTALVDLSKPSAKFGVANLRVGTAAYELKVQVSTDKAQYSIRGKALAKIKVSTAAGQPAADAEVAFAAVDEGLLALQGNDSWDLLNALVQQRPWGVETATAMSEVIGRRHYGRKALAAGGGGGRAGARELFDTLLLWNPRVKLDAKGEATVEVPLNDSLTSHRLVAVADSGSHSFGHGHTSIQVTQDLQVLAGLPPLVREGDNFQALVTLRNTTAREMKLRASLSGTVASPAGSTFPAGPDLNRSPMVLPPQEWTLAAHSAKEISWPVVVPAGAISIAWEVAAEEVGAGAGGVAGVGSTPARDRAKLLQLVKEAVPLRVVQASVAQLDGALKLPVQFPAEGLSGPGGQRSGGLELSLQPRLSQALPGLRRYFENYPYTCLEQLSSKALGLADAQAWARLGNELPTYLDADGLAAYFPQRAGFAASGSDRLTAHLISISHDAGWALPPVALAPMLKGLSQFVQGRIERRHWSPRADLEVRKLAAIAALARHGQADARFLGSVRTSAEAVSQWPTAALLDWWVILQRMPAVPDRNARLTEVQQQVRARLQLGGTTLRFSKEEDDFWWWLMDSPDANAARLLLVAMDEPAWRDEVPRLVLGHLARQSAGAWLTTTANAWSAVALERFGAKFESVPVSGRTLASVSPASAPGPAAPASTVPAAAAATAGSGRIDWATAGATGARADSPQRLRLPWPAGDAALNLNVSHEGTGKPWITVQSLAAIPLKAPVRRGYSLTRSVAAVEQKTPGQWQRGDVMRVRLEVQAQSDMSWVVISDPVPGGATVLGSGLGRDSGIAVQGERREGNASPSHEERSFEAFRSYYAYLPKGQHVLEYTLRLNNPGRFVLPPTRVEAMYAPESFGELPNASLEIKP